ncbi:MAG: hypothetical protein MUF43_10120 [Flavobacterium sp.]|jgi:D-ribose pyranose/furanose isomerase RbsD|nr:hypothetical protein [Flavobacterium sp.]
MRTTFELSIEELDIDFLNQLRMLFEKKKVRLTVIADEIDERDYLFSSEVNKMLLQKSLHEVETGKVVSFEAEEFFQTYQSKIVNANHAIVGD